MAISFIGVGALAEGTTSVAPAYPGGYTAVADDVALVWLAVRVSDTGEFTTPSGYTQQATILNEGGATDLRLSLYTKKLTTSESAPSFSGDTVDVGASWIEIWPFSRKR